MAHEVETMFYNRVAPWHGLGEMVQEALSSEDALRMAGLDWEVTQLPVLADFNGDIRTTHGYKHNVRSTDNKVLGIVTDKYRICQNKDAFAFTDALLDADVKYETAGSLFGGKRVWLLAKMPTEVVLGDEIAPYLVFTNAHDGTGAIKVAITPTRVVCNNTLNMALNGAKRYWSTRHVGDLEYKMEESQRTLELATDYMKKFNTTAELLVDKVIPNSSFQELLAELFPMPKNIDDTSMRTIDNILDKRNTLEYVYNNAPDIQKFKNTGWGVMNAVSDMVLHSEPKRKTATYQNNLFSSVIDGNNIIDKAYEVLMAI